VLETSRAPSKLEHSNLYALKIIDEIFSAQPYPPGYGGTQGSIYGEKGTGKTTLLGRFAQRFLDLGIPIIWRLRPRGDIFPSIDENFRIFVHEADEPFFFEQRGSRLARIDLDYETYDDTFKLVNRQIKDGLNVVLDPSPVNSDYQISERFVAYTKYVSPSIKTEEIYNSGPSAFWFEFSYALVNRKNRGFLAFMFDELSEWLPLNLPHPLSRFVEGYIKVLNDFRRANIHHWFTAHDRTDIEWRVERARIEYSVYFRGSRVKDIHYVKQKTIDNLDKLQYWIARGSNYGIGIVTPFEKTKLIYVFADERGDIPF
jgi:hypothetical protein